MMTVAATPFAGVFTGIVELFVAVPLGIAAGICGVECFDLWLNTLRRRPGRLRRP